MFPRRDDATNKELILTIIDIQGYLSRYGKSHTNWHETLNEVIERLERAERTQKMRGKWIEKTAAGNPNAAGIEEWQSCKCSNCGRYDISPYMYYFSEPNYCSWCGADMRGGQE